jgi:glycine oxidase ThiO
MTQVAIIGCGVIGAAIAYELSQIDGLQVKVCDRQHPAEAATGAALGVLMGAISQKPRGNNLKLRLSSIQRYNTWIPQLEAMTGRRIPFNQQGILRLCFEGEDLAAWKTLADIRQNQGWQLEIYDRAQLAADFPQLCLDRIIGAVYSPADRQVDPTALTLALVAAAQQQGVTFQFETAVTGIDSQPAAESDRRRCDQIHTARGLLSCDWLIIAAGLGSTPLTASLQQPVDIRPVLGQAMRVQLTQPIGLPELQPVITGEDVHLVPLGNGEYWIGATVEFPVGSAIPIADADALEAVRQQAIAFYPAFAEATVLQSWSGLRPRPEGRPAPIIELLPGYSNVVLATGHYRNGILLAPATAEKVRQTIVSSV